MKTEKILLLAALIISIGRLLHIPFAASLLILDLSALFFMYFIFSFYFLADGSIKRQNLPLSILWGLFMGMWPLSILFKLMWWPGDNAMMGIALLTAGIFSVVVYLVGMNSRADLALYYRHLLLRTVGILGMLAVLYVIPSSVIIAAHIKDPKLRDLTIRQRANPRDEAANRALEQYVEQRDSLNKK